MDYTIKSGSFWIVNNKLTTIQKMIAKKKYLDNKKILNSFLTTKNIKGVKNMTYNDYVKNGWILPKKNKYTIRDFKKLVNQGYTQKQARFICICSSIYHFDYNTDHLSKIFYDIEFSNACLYERAI